MRRKCKVCKEAAKYTTATGLAHCGEPLCAIELHKIMKEKQEKAHFRERKKRLNDTVPNWTKKVQTVFNKYIRERDKDKPCISCGMAEGKDHLTGGYWHAGHYRSVGAFPELRFHPLNCHKQCPSCNNHKSGNIIEYRINLEKRIGVDNLEWLEGHHVRKNYRVPELKELHEYWKSELKKLQSD